MASTFLVRISITLHCNTHNEPFHVTTNSFSTRQIPSRATTITCSTNRRRRNTTPITSKITKKKSLPRKNVVEDDIVDEDAFDTLFQQLEEDLKNDDLNGNDHEDVEISEEEMAKLEQELAEALGDDELYAALESIAGGAMSSDADEENDAIDSGEDEDDHDEYEEEVMPVKLKNWQIRRLAYALKNGRRKTKIKDLAAELCLDRADVLKLLRDPPPSLVLMSASLPDKPVSPILEPVEEHTETVETMQDNTDQEPEKKLPVHEMQGNWSARKRLKKVQVETLEQVYKRSKRPTNAMISSIVHVTNLPRKRVVKWFEEKRNEDGVPENRVPYQKPVAVETVFTN